MNSRDNCSLLLYFRGWCVEMVNQFLNQAWRTFQLGSFVYSWLGVLNLVPIASLFACTAGALMAGIGLVQKVTHLLLLNHPCIGLCHVNSVCKFSGRHLQGLVHTPELSSTFSDINFSRVSFVSVETSSLMYINREALYMC